MATGDSKETSTTTLVDVIRIACQLTIQYEEKNIVDLMETLRAHKNALLKLDLGKFVEMMSHLQNVRLLQTQIAGLVGVQAFQQLLTVPKCLVENMAQVPESNVECTEYVRKGLKLAVTEKVFGDLFQTNLANNRLHFKTILGLYSQMYKLMNAYYIIVYELAKEHFKGNLMNLVPRLKEIFCNIVSFDIENLEEKRKCQTLLNEHMTEIGVANYVRLKYHLNLLGWEPMEMYNQTLKDILQTVDQLSYVKDYSAFQVCVTNFYLTRFDFGVNKRESFSKRLLNLGTYLPLYSFRVLMEHFWATKLDTDLQLQFVDKLQETVKITMKTYDNEIEETQKLKEDWENGAQEASGSDLEDELNILHPCSSSSNLGLYVM